GQAQLNSELSRVVCFSASGGALVRSQWPPQKAPQVTVRNSSRPTSRAPMRRRRRAGGRMRGPGPVSDASGGAEAGVPEATGRGGGTRGTAGTRSTSTSGDGAAWAAGGAAGGARRLPERGVELSDFGTGTFE